MTENLIEIDNIEVRYDRHFLAIQGVSMTVAEGDVVVLLGPNGAGKSTILKTISGLLSTERGRVTRGSVTFDGDRVENADPQEMVNRGVTHVLEDRRIFDDMTVEENLRCGLMRNGQRLGFSREDYELAFKYFPQLEEYMDTNAGYVSGGEQQMLSIATGLLYKPRVLLLDEPSLGLAPQLVQQIFETIREINEKEDITIILADQNANLSLDIADYGYVIENGQSKLQDTAAKLKETEEIKEFYLGMGEGESGKYEDVKHYKKRKRWS